MLAALNPHRPPEPAFVQEPERPEDELDLGGHTAKERELGGREHAAALEQWQEYQRAYAVWCAAPETRGAPAALSVTVRDLEQRGLLQYDRLADQWDLHPVVRAVAFNGLRDPDRENLGQQIIDYFSQRPRNPYEQAETIDDLRDTITVVRTLLQMGRKDEALDALSGGLLSALHFNLEAYPESLSLLRPFFPRDWSAPTEDLIDLGLLANNASIAFSGLGELVSSVELDQVAARSHIKAQEWEEVRNNLNNISIDLSDLNRLALAERVFNAFSPFG